MKRRPPARRARPPAWRLPLIAILGVALCTAVGLTAANIVTQSRASDTTTPLSVDPVKPTECNSIEATNRVTGTGVIAGTLGNDWIIGSAATDTIDGLAGDDCIEGKGSDDVIDGGLGNDVCIGGGGNDTFIACETEIQ